MARHSFNLEYMEMMVDDLRRLTEDVTTAVEDADRAAGRLHQTWSGVAADAHRQAHDRWSADFVTMNQTLAQLQATLDRARGNFEAAAGTNLGMWS